MDLRRHPNWENELQAYLEQKREADMTCGDFVTGAVEAITGSNIKRKFKGRLAWVADNLAAAADEIMPRRLPSMARSGDLIMVQGSLGIASGPDGFFMAEQGGRMGLTVVPMAQWEGAWSVG